MVKIAAYAIAKNESKHIKQWVDATKGADVRVVLDTGSTDNTYDLLQKYPVEAHRATLRDFRFDDARNLALDLIPSDVDVCVSLDMDEVPDLDFFDKIREAWKPETNRAWCMWDTGSIWANNNRIHSRNGYRWVKPCHEITKWVKQEPENVIVLETCVRHKPDDSKSRGYYLNLLELAVNEDPSDARMLAYLIREYYFNSNWNKIIEFGVKLEKLHTGWCVENSASYRTVAQAFFAQGDNQEGYNWLVKSAEVDPNSLEPWEALANYHYVHKEWDECFNAAWKVNELSIESDLHYLSDPLVQCKLYDLLSIACWNLNKKGSAKKFARLALEMNPEDKRLASNYYFMVANVKEI
jgi:glycosyltransferase involved in cell wall biosynthesis